MFLESFRHSLLTHLVADAQEFISAGVNAYALGCTDEGLRKELTEMKESGFEIEAMQSYGGSTSLKSKIFSEEVSHSYVAEQFDKFKFHTW